MRTHNIDKILLLIIVHTCFIVESSNAHFLWVTIEGENINIYFEESPSAGDGYYLDSFKIETWVRTFEDIQPQLITTTEKRLGEKKRWLSAEVPYSTPKGIESYGKYGVYRYGKNDVLLHYYARFLDVDRHNDLSKLASAEHMDLDIVPQYDQGNLKLKVLWKGKPVSGSTIHIRGSNRFQRKLKTNASGVVQLEIENAGEYTFRTSFSENKSGRDGNKSYSSIRHSATLIMPLPLKE